MDTRMLREAHDQAFAEIVGAESAIVRSQSLSLNQRQGFSLSRRSEDLLTLLKIIHTLR
ncbi:hypothetical protein ACSBR1_011666 [Camellia fascicularis]